MSSLFYSVPHWAPQSSFSPGLSLSLSLSLSHSLSLSVPSPYCHALSIACMTVSVLYSVYSFARKIAVSLDSFFSSRLLGALCRLEINVLMSCSCNSSDFKIFQFRAPLLRLYRIIIIIIIFLVLLLLLFRSIVIGHMLSVWSRELK